jgi:triosephosphate isomerase
VNRVVIGNWKLNGSQSLLREFAVEAKSRPPACDAVLCVPHTMLAGAQALLQGTPLRWGAQDCSPHVGGAHTGEVSAQMVRDCGARHVIVGHSERRQAHGEADGVVADKARRALEAGLTPIVCIGESAAERDGDLTRMVLRRQLLPLLRALERETARVLIAYEPLWAIGSGDAAAPGLIDDVVQFVAETMSFHAGLPAGAVRLLYGGSVDARNAAALLARRGIAGVLVGSASLRVAEFFAICRAAAQQQMSA